MLMSIKRGADASELPELIRRLSLQLGERRDASTIKHIKCSHMLKTTSVFEPVADA